MYLDICVFQKINQSKTSQQNYYMYRIDAL